MKKRIFALVLAVVMILPMLPISVYAAHDFQSNENLALAATATVSSYQTGSNGTPLDGSKVINNNFAVNQTYNRWAEKDNQSSSWIRLTWDEAVTFDSILIVEAVCSYWTAVAENWNITVSYDGVSFEEEPIASGSGIGADLAISLESTVTARAIQLNVTSKLDGSTRGVYLAEIAVYSTVKPTYPSNYLDTLLASYENIGLLATATASTYASGTSQDHDPSKVVNGNFKQNGTYNRWVEKDGQAAGSAWLRLTWDEAVTFDTLYIVEAIASSYGWNAVVDAFSITASSDGETFDSVPIYTSNGMGAACVVDLHRAVTAKAIQINFLSKIDGTTRGVYIAEVGVFSTMEPPVEAPEIDEDSTNMDFLNETNIALSSTATASSDQGTSYAPSKAIDGTFDVTSNNRWAPQDSTDSQWFMLQWADKVSFDVIRMGEPTGIGDPRADEYTVYASNDGENFTALYTGSGIGAEKIIRFASPVTARYLKIVFTSFLHETNRPNLAEVEVYNTYGGTRLLGFDIKGISSYINMEDATISILLDPDGEHTLTPTVTVPQGSTYAPVGAQDFSGDVVYTVTDKYGASREYTVKVSHYISDGDLIENSGVVVLEWGAVPNAAQYKYHKDELAAFCHFGMNTMTGVEWGDGTESPSDFTLTEPIDADSYVKLLKDAGFSRVIFTVKHHDGFCLWDSAYTTHDIAETGYNGDIVAEFSAACTKYDMPMGIYLSPWDRNQTLYGCYGYTDLEGNKLNISSAEWKAMDESEKMRQYYGEDGEYFTDYNDYFAAQLIELCSNPNYGNNGYICEFWFDGAKLASAPSQHYDTERFDEIVYSYEPGCIIQSGIHQTPEMTTAGNETGRVNDELWSKLGKGGTSPEDYNTAACGNKYNENWRILEADGMMTHGWFWGEDGTKTKNNPKELTYLRDVYRYSIGRGTTLLLNVPLNNKGALDTAIAERLTEWGENVKASYIDGNLLSEANSTIYVDSVYENAAEYGPASLTDGDDSTYWAAAKQDAEILVKLDEKTTFDTVIIEEAIQLGQRIEAFEIYYKNDLGEWIEFFHGKTICGKRIAQSQPVTASEIKINLHGLTDTDGTGICPVVSALSIHKTSEAFELAAAAPLELTEIDNTSSSFTYNGFENVTNKDATGFSYAVGTAGATLTATFDGTFARLAGQLEADSSVKVSLDGGEAQIISAGSAFTHANSAIFEAETDTDGTHTITLEVLSGTAQIDTLYALNNGCAGFVEFEKEVVSTLEDSEVSVKLVRRGGSVGTLALTLDVSDILGLSDISSAYDITFESGETEKTITFGVGRNTEKTGTQSLEISISEAEIAGFASSVRIDVLDTESYESNLISAQMTKAPTKNTYSIGDAFDASGMVIEGVFATNPVWHILYEESGIHAAENAIAYSANVSYRRDTLSSPIFAGALRLNILGLKEIDVFSKPYIGEIEVYNGDNTENIALSATPTVRSETTYNETCQHKLNNGERGSTWNASLASDYPQWGMLTWDSPVVFDTVDIYEYRPPETGKVTGDFYVDALIYDKESFNITDGYTVTPAVFTEAGEQTVTLTFENGISLSTTVTVEGIVLDNTEITLKTNETATLVATYYPSGASAENAEWISSNEEVATVDGGVVTPHKVGETVITVKVGTESVKCVVKVVSEYEQYYDSSIAFEGFSIRVSGYNGLRSIFSFDNAKKAEMEKNGFTLIEYGVIFTSQSNYESYGAEITKNEHGEYVTAKSSIAKIAVGKGDEIVGNTLKGSDINGTVYFAGSVVNYSDNYTTGVHVRAYSVYRDALGNEYIGYSYSEDEDYKFIDLYGMTLDMYVNGAINASNIDEDMIWSYLEKAGGVTLSADTDYTYSEDVTDFEGNSFEGSFRYVGIPAVTQLPDENNALAFEKSNVTITMLHDFRNNSYVAVYRGEGAVPGARPYMQVGAFSQLSPYFAVQTGSACTGVSNARPAPTLKSAASGKITTVIFDYGITELGREFFARMSALDTVVYSSTLSKVDQGFSIEAKNIATVYLAQESGNYVYHEKGLADVSAIESFSGTNAFGSSCVSKIHLPASISSIPSTFAPNASNLHKLWCGNTAEPATGVADFTGSTLTAANENGFIGTKITSYIFAS